jgi:hypothetical protein
MGTFRKPTPQELQEIKDSVAVAVEVAKRVSWNVHKPKRGELHIPNQPRLPDNDACRRYLQQKDVQDTFLRALRKGDGHFFVRFGRLLSKMFVFIEDTKYPLVQVLPFFLIDHWARPKDGLPEFCYLTPSDLTAVCIEHLGNESLEEEGIVKLRQRLKLKPYRYKLHAKYVAGKMTFPEMDK